jgi:L-malate glycosyltransferase
MKKLLIVTDSFFYRMDGIVRFLDEIVPRIRPRFDIHIIAPGNNEEIDKEIKRWELNVKYFPIRKTVQDFSMAWPSLSEIKKEVCGSDIVWIQSLGPLGMCAAHYAKYFNIPVAYYNHIIEWEVAKSYAGAGNKFLSWISKKLVKFYFSRFKLLMAPSEDTKKKIKEIVDTNIEIVSLGVDTERFSRTENKEKKEIVIGYVGRVANEKNLTVLKKAFDIVRNKMKNDEIKLLIVGDGPAEEKEKVSGKNVEITGFVGDVETYLNKMDIFVMPSVTETTSLATIEAMACELPIIASRVGYMMHYVLENYNGSLFDPLDADELANKLETLIKNKQLRETLGKRARTTVMQAPDWERVAMNVGKLLENL